MFNDFPDDEGSGAISILAGIEFRSTETTTRVRDDRIKRALIKTVVSDREPVRVCPGVRAPRQPPADGKKTRVSCTSVEESHGLSKTVGLVTIRDKKDGLTRLLALVDIPTCFEGRMLLHGQEEKQYGIFIIQASDSSTHSISVKEMETVDELKEKVIRTLNLLEPADHTLTYNGENLDPGMSLVEYGIEENANILLSSVPINGGREGQTSQRRRCRIL